MKEYIYATYDNEGNKTGLYLVRAKTIQDANAKLSHCPNIKYPRHYRTLSNADINTIVSISGEVVTYD